MGIAISDKIRLLLVQLGQVGGNHLISNGVVLKVALDERIVAWHIDESVTREVEEDHLFFASLNALLSFADGGCDGVTALGSRNDTLGTRKECACLKGLELWDIYTMHQTVLDEL